jgi:hypothetical protein
VNANSVNIHATCVAIGGKGVLIEGPSGSGKSLLAFALVDGAQSPRRTAHFVSDDRTELFVSDGRLIARAPDALKGLAELHGVGVLNVDAVDAIEPVLLVRLCPPHMIERMPYPDGTVLCGVALPLLKVPERNAFVAAMMIRHHPAISSQPAHSSMS